MLEGKLSAGTAKRLQIRGIVQGVGFRPFVCQLARSCGVRGLVANSGQGVQIHAEGGAAALDRFITGLQRQAPPLAHVTEILQAPAAFKGWKAFTISASRSGNQRTTLIPPDVSICEECARELSDPRDRRFAYAFINCTNCGPRYTIVDDIPYDRANTSMKHFPMCPACQQEYEDPQSRRFHAQPNACPECGPHLTLLDEHGTPRPGDDAIADAGRLLARGKILAIKGIGGFHLAVDARNEYAVTRLRLRKNRQDKPLALMAADTSVVEEMAELDAAEKELLESPQRPIVLLRQRLPHVIAPGVAPQNRYFGVMLPYTPLHCLLLARGIPVLVMTSGNPSEEPIAIDNRAAVERLAGIADGFLIHNRDIYIRSDDSIVCRASGETRMLRRSRGYVPVPLFLDRSMPPILACGAELKNTVCLTRQTHAFVSQHLGDLKNLPALEYFRQTIDHMQRILDIAPQYIAHDLHPDYLSTRYALEQTAIPKIAVQHHHAHLVACLAENNLHGKVIGLALDGTGYGTDGAIWGGEAMVADRLDFRRAAHPAYVPMPGGDAAIREPWRMAISYLLDAFGEDPAQLNLPFLANRDPGRVRTIVEMTANRINAPLTSSLGRLFDAVAAIAGLRGRVTFEGQAAMELETVAADGRFPLDPGQSYPYEIRDDGSWPLQILTAPLIRAVVADLRQGASVAGISRRFHATLIFLFAEVCDRIRRETGLQRVVLSGGVFQNVLLLEGLSEILQAGGFSVFTHRQVPTNDGGICLGQAAAAAARIAGSPPAPQKTGR